MFSEKDLQALLDYSADSQVLSVYLNTDPTKINTEAAKLQLRNWLKKVEIPEDGQKVEDFINLEYDWSAKTLVLFSAQAVDYFQTYQFNLSAPEIMFVGDRPIIRPLVRLIDAFSGWGVVLVDKQGARFFSFDLGELTKKQSIDGEEIKQFKRGGGSMPGRMGAADLSGNIENVIEQNIKDVIDAASAFFSKHHIRRILIGGTDDNIARFKDELPKSWQSLVVGELSVGMNASDSEVWDQAMEEALIIQKKINQSLVEQAITLAAKGNNGVIGLTDTLSMIHEGRIKTLLVMQDFEQEGFRCDGCGHIAIQAIEICPLCGGSFNRIDAAVEMAVHEALRNNAEVKVISESEALEKAGKICGILRY